jgi:hypothetical protein
MAEAAILQDSMIKRKIEKATEALHHPSIYSGRIENS